jgi:hypothetical protein|tara:strand:- start:209 stop:310 length:102 start_codon:yes stop_codon:yes gene_type:complete
MASKDWAHIQPEIIITAIGIARAEPAWPKNCDL